MHYTLNNGMEERVWAVIGQNLLLSVKNEGGEEVGTEVRGGKERRRDGKRGEETGREEKR